MTVFCKNINNMDYMLHLNLKYAKHSNIMNNIQTYAWNLTYRTVR